MKIRAYYVVYQDVDEFELEYAGGPFSGRQAAEDWILANRNDMSVAEHKNIFKIVPAHIETVDPLTIGTESEIM